MSAQNSINIQMNNVIEGIGYYTRPFLNDVFNFSRDLHPSEENINILRKYISTDTACEALIKDEVYPVAEIDNHIVLFDCMMGMPYMLGHDGVFCIYDFMASAQYDIKEAADLRWKVNNQGKSMLRLLSPIPIDTPNVEALLGMPFRGYRTSELFEALPVFEVNSRNELDLVIEKIQTIVPRKLWFRGQAKEYQLHRSRETIQTLQLPHDFELVPSLIPSLGRTEGNISLSFRDYICWMEAFNIWLVSEYGEFKEKIPKKYNEILNQLNDLTKFRDYRKNLWRDKNIPDEVEEVLCGAEWLYEAGGLCMQQYGMRTTYLDITTDINIALYFSNTHFNPSTGNMEEIESTGDRVIYVFPELSGTVTMESANSLFDRSQPWPLRIPERIVRQKCGLLSGANSSHKNTYGFRPIAKIMLHNPQLKSDIAYSDLFPSRYTDCLFDILSRAQPKLHGLYG